TYYVYVRASCSGVWSAWTSATSFTTLCDTELNTPTGETSQTLVEGSTLANLEVEGENLVWYADEDLTIMLDDATILVDGTTYYVVQAIGNCVSEALAITVEVTLSRDIANAVTLKAYPNPVKDVLNISSNREITKIEVLNMLGQVIISNTTNSTETQVNLSGLVSGNYFVKVTANNSTKILKVVK